MDSKGLFHSCWQNGGAVNIRKGDISEKRNLTLYFNPFNEEFTLRKEKASNYYWFKVSDILQKEYIEDIVEEAKKAGLPEGSIPPTKKKLEGFRTAIFSYPVNLYWVPEGTLKYDPKEDNFLDVFEKISKMFVRLNMTGTRIKMTDLMLALLTAKTRKGVGESFRKWVIKLDKKLEDSGWDIGEPILMRVYMVIATGETRFRNAKEKLDKFSPNEIMYYLKEMDEVLHITCTNILRDLNVRDQYLKSQYSLVTLAYYVYKKGKIISPRERDEMQRWLLLSSFNRRYTGRLESDLSEDIELIKQGKSLKSIEDNLAFKDLNEDAINTPYEKEHLLALCMLLRDSYDMLVKAGLPKKIRDLSRLNIHHIFPEDLLKKVYGKNGKIGEMDVETAYDYVANITLISEEANKKIKNQRPDEYLNELDETIIRSHYIPYDKDLWKPDNFLEFLKERSRLLLDGLRSLTKVT